MRIGRARPHHRWLDDGQRTRAMVWIMAIMPFDHHLQLADPAGGVLYVLGISGLTVLGILLAGWAYSGLLAGGPVAVRLLYDERYYGAGWAIQALSIGGWFWAMSQAHTAALLAMGRSQWLSVSSAAKLLGMCVFIPNFRVFAA